MCEQTPRQFDKPSEHDCTLLTLLTEGSSVYQMMFLKSKLFITIQVCKWEPFKKKESNKYASSIFKSESKEWCFIYIAYIRHAQLTRMSANMFAECQKPNLSNRGDLLATPIGCLYVLVKAIHHQHWTNKRVSSRFLYDIVLLLLL